MKWVEETKTTKCCSSCKYIKKGLGLSMIAAGHCTGWRAVTAPVNAFGNSIVNPSIVGKRFTF